MTLFICGCLFVGENVAKCWLDRGEIDEFAYILLGFQFRCIKMASKWLFCVSLVVA